MKYHIVKNDRDERDRPQFAVAKPQWKLEDVVLPPDIVERLEDIECFAQYHQILFNDWEFHRFMRSSRGIAVNFFGPSGTGKTITADALASRLGVSIIRVNYADIESKFMGETSKNLHSLFQTAEQERSAELRSRLWKFHYLVDAFTGGLVTIVHLAGGFLKRTRFFQRVYAYFTQGRSTFQQHTDMEIPASELPREIRSALEGYAELPVMRIQT